jgi:hypothetical protein
VKSAEKMMGSIDAPGYDVGKKIKGNPSTGSGAA